ncbi:MAG: hypothetical protein J6K89_05280 [Oscillospiraceae bacterium]|nr:hypothetical protein [Oscillospiraceae bacterium]
MKTYIGTKVIEAEPMTRGDYNQSKGWTLPVGENPEDEGYRVIYPDGYISWSPKEVFENTYREIGEVDELTMPLLRTKYTRVFVESAFSNNAPHNYFVAKAEDNHGLCHIHFQEGPIKEAGVNGVCDEDLICMVIDRMERFQNSPFACRENALAITKLEEALLWLHKRTMAREQRGVEGTHIV